MTTFIEEIVSDIISSGQNLSETVFILPSKRAGVFLRKETLKQTDKTLFSPKILSIEEFIENIADLTIADNTFLLFELYDVYLTINPDEDKENIETFSSWAATLLNDFNEIDRYMIDQNSFFGYLDRIQEIEHWYVKDEKTPLIKNYLSFWKSLPVYYEAFVKKLLSQGTGHQGLVYREAAGNIEHYIQANSRKHIFIGFNALNHAEERIIQELLENGNAEIYWDADIYFMNNDTHSASYFLKQYQKQWKFYRKNPFKTISSNYTNPKKISTVGVPKNVGQAKQTGEILAGFSQEQLENTAVVLADANLLLPILNALPENVKELNITMGMPLSTMPATSFFEDIILLQAQNKESYYYKDVLKIVNHPLGKIVLRNDTRLLEKHITEKNRTYISFSELTEISSGRTTVLTLLFSPWNDNIDLGINRLKEIIFEIKQRAEKNDELLLESLFRIFEVICQIERLNKKYPHITSAQSLHKFFKEAVSATNIDFQGEPYRGLQVMGILETRALDYETIILTSVNEGILPAGKNNNSFIPYDLKKEYKLPAYREKDAIYTYHFYRLLHRAKNVFLLYNTHTEGINSGEKSRFLLQMAHDKLPSHHFQEFTAAPKINIRNPEKKQIEKTPEMLREIEEIAKSGFSPSALTTYIRNPIDFYYRYVLKINETVQVEETVEANTLGTVVHNTLQELYEPFVNKILTANDIEQMIKTVNRLIAENFDKAYHGGDISSGKNLIIYEVAKRYVYNFLRAELKNIKSGSEIYIKSIEEKMEASVDIPELPFEVKIKGTMDRADEADGTLRIIDYKTGRVTKPELTISDWEDITADYKYSKAFQVLAYSLMWNEKYRISQAQAGIISFKNLKEGLMLFRDKNQVAEEVNQEILNTFSEILKKLILEIFNPEIPFIEKEV